MTQYRVHELAGRYGVTADDVIAFLAESGRRVRGRSAVLGESDAAKVRRRFDRSLELAADPTEPIPRQRLVGADSDLTTPVARRPRPSVPTSPPAAETTAVAIDSAPVTAGPADGFAASLLNPFAVPVSTVPGSESPGTGIADSEEVVRHGIGNTEIANGAPSVSESPRRPSNRARSATAPLAKPDLPDGVPPEVAALLGAENSEAIRRMARKAGLTVPSSPAKFDLSAAPAVEEYWSEWEQRGISRSERQQWLDAGLRRGEFRIADQCRLADIAPDNLPLKVSGRTVLARLRDGETATSVWARIQDGESQPRRGTRLSGRFQLG